jgi:AcrR family transcriptional regulator
VSPERRPSTPATGTGSLTAPAAPATTAETITAAAVELFFEHGYEATTLRQIAAKVGIQVGSLYNHISSKEELLFSIMSGIIEELLAELEAGLDGVEDPVERLRAAVGVHVFFHTARAREVFIGNSELRSLEPAKRRTVVRLRDRYETVFSTILEDGVAAGAFEVSDLKLTTYAVLAMLTQPSTWYQPDGRLDLDKIAEVYGDLILRSLASPATRRKLQRRSPAS